MLEVINTNESDSAHKDFLPRQNKISFHEKNLIKKWYKSSYQNKIDFIPREN